MVIGLVLESAILLLYLIVLAPAEPRKYYTSTFLLIQISVYEF